MMRPIFFCLFCPIFCLLWFVFVCSRFVVTMQLKSLQQPMMEAHFPPMPWARFNKHLYVTNFINYLESFALLICRDSSTGLFACSFPDMGYIVLVQANQLEQEVKLDPRICTYVSSFLSNNSLLPH